MKIQASVIAHRNSGTVTLLWREVLSVEVIQEDYGFGPESFEIPTYGRTLASKEVPVELFYNKSLPLSEWVESLLPKPNVTDDEEVPLPD